MAMRKEVRKLIYGNQLIFDRAYHRIENYQGKKDYAEITVVVYDNEQTQNVLEQRIYTFSHSVLENAPNIIKQGYRFLAKQKEYEGAIMVLENGQSI